MKYCEPCNECSGIGWGGGGGGGRKLGGYVRVFICEGWVAGSSSVRGGYARVFISLGPGVCVKKITHYVMDKIAQVSSALHAPIPNINNS